MKDDPGQPEQEHKPIVAGSESTAPCAEQATSALGSTVRLRYSASKYSAMNELLPMDRLFPVAFAVLAALALCMVSHATPSL